MPSQSCNFFHGWILPNNYLIERVAMSAHQLVIGLREDEVADLRASVDSAQGVQSQRVPEPDVLVSRAAARCKKTSV